MNREWRAKNSRELSGISRDLIKILWAFQLKNFYSNKRQRIEQRRWRRRIGGRCDEGTAFKMFVVVHSIQRSMSGIQKFIGYYRCKLIFDIVFWRTAIPLNSSQFANWNANQKVSNIRLEYKSCDVAKLCGVCSRRRVIFAFALSRSSLHLKFIVDCNSLVREHFPTRIKVQAPVSRLGRD